MSFFNNEKILNNLSMAVCFLISYFMPIAEWLAVIIFAVITDMVTGISAALKKKEQIKSRRMVDTIFKINSYFLCIMLAFIIENSLKMDIPAVKILGALVLSVELKSIDENIKVITGISVFNSIIKAFKKNEGN